MALGDTVTVIDADMRFEWSDEMLRCQKFEAGTVTALQPPPFPTHSVNPDHSAFGTTTLHAENRTTDPPYDRRPDWHERILVSAAGRRYL